MDFGHPPFIGINHFTPRQTARKAPLAVRCVTYAHCPVGSLTSDGNEARITERDTDMELISWIKFGALAPNDQEAQLLRCVLR